MDKYEYQVCADQIKLLISERRYAEAMNIADTIDWRKVRSVSMLQTVSEVYKINKKYEEARDILLLAYDRYPNGRTIVYALCELAIKLNDVLQAKELYEEFVTLAPEDTSRYILLYKLYEALDVSLEERIEVLEEFKKRDYRERWAYELAYLYHKTGQETRCVEECDELILWFGDGRYVKKAMELKMQHTRLSKEQQNKYEGRQEPISDNFMKLQQTPVQQIYDTDPQAGNPQQIPIQPYNGQYSQGYMNTDPSQQMYAGQGQQMGQIPGQQTPVPGQMAGQPGQMQGQDMQMTVTPAGAPVQRTAQMLTTSEIDSIRVQPVNVGMYNTMDLQNALSANISEFFEKENGGVPESNVQLSADPEAFEQQLYENDTMGFTTGNSPVIPVSMLEPAENEMDDVPDESEDVQITTFMPINAELVTDNGQAASEAAGGEPASMEPDEDNKEETYAEEAYIEAAGNEPVSGETEEETDRDTETDEITDAETDVEADEEISEETGEAVTEETEEAEEEITEEAEEAEEKTAEETGEEVRSKQPDYELDEEDNNENELDEIYKGWEDQKRENEERRIQEAKEKSLIQTSDIMAQLKGVLPEIDDIARPTPPRVVTKEDTGEIPGIEPVFKPYSAPQALTETEPASVSIPLPADEVKAEEDFAKDAQASAEEAAEAENDTESADTAEDENTEVTAAEEEQEAEAVTEPEEETEEKEPEKASEEGSVEEAAEEPAEESDEGSVEETEEEPTEETEEEPREESGGEAAEEVMKESEEDAAEEPEEEPAEETAKESMEESEEEPTEESDKEPLKKSGEEPADEFSSMEISFDPNEDMEFETDKDEGFDPEKLEVSSSVIKGEAAYLKDNEIKSNDDLYFREIMNIEDSEEEVIDGEKAGLDSKRSEDELTYSEDEEAARKAAFEVTSELPKYPYEGLEDYGEVEEIEVIEQPEGLDGIMKTNDIPIDAIAQANYEAGLEVEEEEEVPKKKSKKKHPSYMKETKAAVSKRDFDKEEQEVFGRFEGIQWLKAEIVNAIDNISMESSKGNVIVMGSEASGRRTIAIDIVKVMQKLENEFKGKVAKISGEALNKKDIPLTIKKLRRGALIIENAGGLTPSSARIVAEALELETEPVLVVMEGDKEGIQKLLDSSKKIMDKVFNARIDLQDFTTDDLVAYGKGYAKELGYAIDEMGVLAFYRRIGDMQTLEHTVTLEEVRDIIDNAIKHVDKKNMSHLMDVILAKRYDDDDCIILREKDFIV